MWTVAGSGTGATQDGNALAASFLQPRGIVVVAGSSGGDELYVVSQGNVVRKITWESGSGTPHLRSWRAVAVLLAASVLLTRPPPFRTLHGRSPSVHGVWQRDGRLPRRCMWVGALP